MTLSTEDIITSSSIICSVVVAQIRHVLHDESLWAHHWLMQDVAGWVRIRMFFRAGPSQAALALCEGHAVAVSGVLAPPAEAAARRQTAELGDLNPALQSTWHEVRRSQAILHIDLRSNSMMLLCEISSHFTSIFWQFLAVSSAKAQGPSVQGCGESTFRVSHSKDVYGGARPLPRRAQQLTKGNYIRQGEYGAQLTNLSSLQAGLTSSLLQCSTLSLAAAGRLCSSKQGTASPTLMLCQAEVSRLLTWVLLPTSAWGGNISSEQKQTDEQSHLTNSAAEHLIMLQR